MSGQVIVSPAAWSHVGPSVTEGPFFQGYEVAGSDGFVRVSEVTKKIRMRAVPKSLMQGGSALQDERLERLMESYVPSSLDPFFEHGMDSGDWCHAVGSRMAGPMRGSAERTGRAAVMEARWHV